MKIKKNGKVIRLTESDLKRIVKRVLTEQNEDEWLETNYVKRKLDKGYTEVDKIDLSDGTYHKGGGGYGIIVQDEEGNDLGYYIVTNGGIRGMWSGQEFEISGGKPDLNVYKILYKDLGNPFLEKSYVKPSLESGYTEVDKIDLPDGTYYKSGGGYSVIVQDEDGNDLGYEVITNGGIRGMWSGQEFEISGGKPDLNVYKILFKK